MDNIGNLLKEKGSTIHAAAAGSTVLQVVNLMCAARVGAMLVVEAGNPVGIFSERDLMTRVVLAHLDPASTKVDDVMTRGLLCVGTDTRLTEAMAIMTERRCRHLPVVNEGKVVGMVSIGDIVRWISHDQEFEIRMLTDYITGKYPA